MISELKGYVKTYNDLVIKRTDKTLKILAREVYWLQSIDCNKLVNMDGIETIIIEGFCKTAAERAAADFKIVSIKPLKGYKPIFKNDGGGYRIKMQRKTQIDKAAEQIVAPYKHYRHKLARLLLRDKEVLCCGLVIGLTLGFIL